MKEKIFYLNILCVFFRFFVGSLKHIFYFIFIWSSRNGDDNRDHDHRGDDGDDNRDHDHRGDDDDDQNHGNHDNRNADSDLQSVDFQIPNHAIVAQEQLHHT